MLDRPDGLPYPCMWGTVPMHISVVTRRRNFVYVIAYMFSQGEKAGSANKATHVSHGRLYFGKSREFSMRDENCVRHSASSLLIFP